MKMKIFFIFCLLTSIFSLIDRDIFLGCMLKNGTVFEHIFEIKELISNLNSTKLVKFVNENFPSFKGPLKKCLNPNTYRD